MTSIDTIIYKIKNYDNLITAIHTNDIQLSLICNLDDIRTYSYAKSNFPKFYDRLVNEYSALVDQLTPPEFIQFRIIAENSLEMIKVAHVLFMERLMEKQQRNE